MGETPSLMAPQVAAGAGGHGTQPQPTEQLCKLQLSHSPAALEAPEDPALPLFPATQGL